MTATTVEITKPRLLVAEDDQINRKALGLMLQMADFAIDFAEDGQQAVEMWEHDHSATLCKGRHMKHNNRVARAIRNREGQ